MHFWASNGHADLLEIIMEKDPLIVNSVDDDKNTPFHTLCKNTVSSKQDLIYMYNMLKKYGWDRRAKNIHDETGLKIIEERIKFSNPYDSSLTAVQGFMEYIEPTKHKSLITISSWPKSKLKRFSGISIIESHNK